MKWVRYRTETESPDDRFQRMTRYYTHVRIGADVALDTDGEEFESSEAAAKSAREGARITVSNEIEAGRDPVSLTYMIHDHTGELVTEFGVTATVSGLE